MAYSSICLFVYSELFNLVHVFLLGRSVGKIVHISGGNKPANSDEGKTGQGLRGQTLSSAPSLSPNAFSRARTNTSQQLEQRRVLLERRPASRACPRGSRGTALREAAKCALCGRSSCGEICSRTTSTDKSRIEDPRAQHYRCCDDRALAKRVIPSHALRTVMPNRGRKVDLPT